MKEFKKQLDVWRNLKAVLDKTKKAETNLRRELCEHIVTESGKEMKNGRLTVKGEFDDLKFTSVQALSYSLDKAVLKSIWEDLTEEEQAVILNEPKLALAPYKKLDEDCLIHEAIITKFDMPTLKAEINDGD